jgi:hypothetical protein
MKTLYTVNITVQHVFQGEPQRFTESTLADTPEDARSNIRERYRHAHQLQINRVSG